MVRLARKPRTASQERAARNKGRRKMVGGNARLYRGRLLPASERLFEVTNERKRDVFAPGACSHLDVERKSFRRRANPHGRAGPSGQVVHLRVAEAAAVLILETRAMQQSGEWCHRRKDGVVVFDEA